MHKAMGAGSGPGNPLRETGKGKANNDRSDTGLVMHLARGRADALAEAYRRHGASVYGVAGRLCGPLQAEEVTRTVFLSLWRSPGDFDPDKGSLRSLLVAMAHRQAVDLQRADTARPAREPTTPACELEQKVLANGASGAIGNLLPRLPTAERQAIILAYFGGYTRGQVAALLSLPAETVNASIRTGIGRLRANLIGERRDFWTGSSRRPG